jgi:hypothetical protein
MYGPVGLYEILSCLIQELLFTLVKARSFLFKVISDVIFKFLRIGYGRYLSQ